MRANPMEVVGRCSRAWRVRYSHIWIDTCCIDQKSSSESAESINSMVLLYANSHRCYAYFEDVNLPQIAIPRAPKFRKSIWFKRALQELVVPHNAQFLNKSWRAIHSKNTMASTINEITGIDYGVLCGSTKLRDIRNGCRGQPIGGR